MFFNRFKEKTMDITLNNYEEYLLSYVDGELDEQETAALMRFLQAHPDKRKELALLQAVVLPAEEEISFPQKQSLYRKEEPKAQKVFILKRYPWLSAAAAACIALLAVWALQPGNKAKTGNDMAAVDNTTPPAAHPDKPATLSPDTVTQRLAVTNQPEKSKRENAAPAATAKIKVEKNQKEQALPSVPSAPNGKGSEIAANTVKPTLPALSSLDIPAEDSGVDAALAMGNVNVQHEKVLNAPPANKPGVLPSEAHIKKDEVLDSKIVNTTEALAVAKRGLDSTITQKLEDINEKTSGFFNHIAKNGIKIGRVTFAFNN